MGIVQKDAFRTTVISLIGVALGYINKGLLFLLILTQEQIGLINLLITVGTLFAQLSSFGTAFTTLKFFPFFRNNDNKHHGFLPFIIRITIAGTLASILGFFVFRSLIESWYIEKSEDFVNYYWWVLPIGIGYVVYLLLEAYLRSFYKNILSVFSYDIILRLCVTASLVLFWKEWISFDVFIKINALVYLIPPAILVVYLWKTNELFLSVKDIRISKRFQKLIFRFSAYNYLNSLGVSLVISLDVMMIAQMMGLKPTGVYSTIIFLASALLVPHRSLLRISAPLVAEYWKNRDMKAMNELYKKSGSVSLLIGLGSFIIVWLNIDLLFSFLDVEFQPGIWVFFFLMMGRLFEMFFGLTGIIFSTSKKYKYDLYFTSVLVVIVYAMNVWFIPKWGIVGAAVSTAIALMLFNFSRYLFISFSYRLNPFEKNQFIVLGLGILTILAGEYFGGMTTNLWIRSVIVTVLFLLLFVLPVFIFQLEKQSVTYVKNALNAVSGKLKSKRK
ncbi:MAG: polysaccharide biosynthesis C-terminal domain-containing protein [Crocinitomicaceae bacterium]|nr:polysaccharide biosynthesis C-terminal domain-containing protein [Crocinitomicaceae bacterium]